MSNPGQSGSNSPLDGALARLDQFIRQRLDHATPGLAIALTDRDRTLRVATYGYADLATKPPVTDETRFDIASVGKTFTAIALLQQYDAGLLDLDAPISTYLPWFLVPSRFAPIAARHLLSHTAGIVGTYSKTPGSRYEIVALRDTEAAYPPGAHFHYSNVGYKALGFLLEAVANQPRSKVIRAGILDPLGMAATRVVLTQEVRDQQATGYAHRYDDRPPRRGASLVPATWSEFLTGDGGVLSTADRDLRLLLAGLGAEPPG